MKMKKSEDLKKGQLIRVAIYARPNFRNGKYRATQIGLDDLSGIKESDIFFLETLKMKADLADKMIAEAESQGKNTSDPRVMKELGEEINAIGKPIHRSEAVMTAIFNSIGLVLYYGIALGIWGLVFNKSFLFFGLCGGVVGFLISLLFGGVVAFQRTKEKVREMSFMVGYLWGNLGIIVGLLGLVTLVIRLIF